MRKIILSLSAVAVLVACGGPPPDNWDRPGLVVDRNKGWGMLWIKVGFDDGTTATFKKIKKVYRNRCRVGTHWPDCRKGPFAR